MDDFTPSFDDDFLDNYDPGDFNDEDEEFCLTTTANKQAEDPPPKIQNENEHPIQPDSRHLKRQLPEQEEPLGMHPLDWFIRTEFDTVDLKRKKMEQAELKSLSLVDRIVAKRNQLNEEPVAFARRSVPSEGYLQFAPTDGSGYYQLTSPDCLQTGYIGVYSLEQMKAPSSRRTKLSMQQGTLDDSTTLSETITLTQEEMHRKPCNQLWIDKYQPRSYLELLSENEHNKVVLAWLKLWDQKVFRRKQTYDPTVSDFYKNMLEVEESPPHLPKKKMLFLHGPSGCSKSTLAKIAAATAGYSPVFLDASEFSSLGAFMDTITAKTSYLKPDFNQKEAKKPYCLIIESIDAASNEIISGLIGGLERPQSKKSKKQSMGLRPVILIGNLFAQSTRRLRPLCFSVHIAGLNRPRTIARLEKICATEGLDIKRHVILEVFEQCNSDIRMCLNQLQFLSSVLWRDALSSNSYTLRVSEFSIFDALNIILTTNGHYNGNRLLPPRQRAKTIANMMSKRSDVETIYHAIFYNTSLIGKLKTHQRRQMCKLLMEEDAITSYMKGTQNWSLLPYTKVAAVQIHFLAAGYTSKRLMYNLGFMKFNERVRACRDILDSFMGNMKPCYRIPPPSLQLYFLPALHAIVQPACNLIITQIQFCSPEERDIINRIVEVMNFYGLTYSTSHEDAELEMRLEPRIESVVVYHPSTSHSATTLNVKTKRLINHMISRKQLEIEAVKSINQLSVSQERNQGTTTLLLSDHQRIPGLAHLRQNADTRGDVVYITDTKLVYRQGNSQAIRTKILNRDFIVL